ncbi:hypothetical protein O6H91_03G114500 [Diphasiastrum complanatum]|uniref:Uncharacterized protein n=3 Tax=Diphasiastrum complanatum TaxID=34168 RepID=A0ACC2EB08_DIPCM|nr:hypothetical protein O6H91_03G114500 [Diphasiastrum complanatum]
MAQLSVRGQAAMAMDKEGEQQQGVLLYYKFVSVPDPDQVRQWFQDLCSSLSLLGRVRVSPDGVNVTVGGTMACLRKHINAVEQHPLFNECDFKLAESSNPINANAKLAVECGFDSLSVRLVKELVTLGLHPSLTTPSIKSAGKHLLPQEFHQILQSIGTALVNGLHGHKADGSNTECEKESLEVKESIAGNSLRLDVENVIRNPNCGVVLLDARNIYETRIGRFTPPTGVEFMESFSRQYSDLPVWIDQNADQLRNKQILMYCTGGVRCEMASAYIRSKGEGFEDVFQLSGGIQRYLETYPDGGFFKGKNFVFDYRIAVPSSSNEVVASCLACGISFDDYSSRTRCCKCRMLILICPSCQAMDTRPTNNLAHSFICELCKKQDKSVAACNLAAEYLGENNRNWTVQCNVNMPACKVSVSNPCQTSIAGLPKPKLRILCLHGFRQNASNLKGRLASFSKKLKHVAEFIFVDAPHELPFIYHLQHNTSTAAAYGDVVTDVNKEAVDTESLPYIWKKKYSWLIGPSSQNDMDLNEVTSHRNQYWISRKDAFDPLQYQTQYEGWPETWHYLQKVFAELGPFDGVLGFSQGAAVAAALCPLISRTNLHNCSVSFKFVILCSGFPSPVYEHKSMMPQSNNGLLFDCPSLHIFCGNSGYDRQIAVDESEKLASMFTKNSSFIVQHSSGHMIPTQPEYLQQYLSFLKQFQ